MTKHLLGAILLASLLTACGGGNTTPPTPSQASLVAQSVAVSVGSPQASPAASHKVYALDSAQSNGVIRTYLLDGTPTTPTITVPPNTFPISLAADKNGTIYLGSFHTNAPTTITTYNPDGTTGSLTITGTRVPAGIAIDGNGKIYVADPSNHELYIYNADGSPSSSPASMAMNAPTDVAVDASGKIYVLNVDSAPACQRSICVTVFNPDETLAYNVTGNGVSNPFAIAVDATGVLYVANRSQEGNVGIFNPDGSLRMIRHFTASGPWGITVGPFGDSYAGIGCGPQYACRIRQYLRDGEATALQMGSGMQSGSALAAY